MKEIPLMFCFDSNYVIPASVAFYSLLQKTTLGGGVKLRLFVIHHNISSQDQAKLQKWRKNQFLTKIYRIIKENPSLIFKLNSYQKMVEMIKNKIFFT